jgi:hypothetical protein
MLKNVNKELRKNTIIITRKLMKHLEEHTKLKREMSITLLPNT